MHLAYTFKVQCSNYQLAQRSYTLSYCLLVPSIIVVLTTETMFSQKILQSFGRSFIIQFICVTHTNIFYMKLAANSCQIFIIYIKLIANNPMTGGSLQPKE